jgi:hypothetical protein
MKRINCFICGLVAVLLASGFTAYAAGSSPADNLAPGNGQPQSKSCCIPRTTKGPGTAGSGAAPSETPVPAADTAVIEDGVQVIRSVLAPRSYPDLTVQAGLPVRWIITADETSLNGCNNAISIPALDIYQRLAVGENIIEFMPDKTGVIFYSCWMGMISATIMVTEAAP